MSDICDKPYTSVIVTVRNEEATIRHSITSLIDQSLKKELYEIIVVDGRSTDNTCQIVNIIASNAPVHISLIEQEGTGISCARNTGIKYSKGDIVIFIDGDAFASYTCLEQYAKCFSDSKIGYAWGPVLIGNPESLVAKLLYSTYYSLVGAHGANIAYRRAALDKVGYFDEGFIGRGDELVVNLKILHAGYLSKKCSTALVYHELPTSILNFLRLRYADGFSNRKIFYEYLNTDEKKIFNQRLFMKVLATVIFVPLFAYLSYRNLFVGAFILSLISFGLIAMYRYIGAKIDDLNLIQVFLSVFLVTIGHLIEIFGELSYLVKNSRDRQNIDDTWLSGDGDNL